MDSKQRESLSRSEQDLLESERRYLWATHTSSLSAASVSPDVAGMLGYNPKEAMALTWGEILVPDAVEIVMKSFVEELTIENMEREELFRTRPMILELIRKDGTLVQAEAKFAFLDYNGRSVGMLQIAPGAIERETVEVSVPEPLEAVAATG